MFVPYASYNTIYYRATIEIGPDGVLGVTGSMNRTLIVFLVSLASCGPSGPDTPTCRIGCPCGRTCISCEDQCHISPATEEMCSGGGGSCTIPTPRSCTDFTGGAWCATGSSRVCSALGNGATYSTAACSTAGRVGSCVVNSGATSEIVLRFYPPSTTATAQAACGQQAGSRFVAN